MLKFNYLLVLLLCIGPAASQAGSGCVDWLTQLRAQKRDWMALSASDTHANSLTRWLTFSWRHREIVGKFLTTEPDVREDVRRLIESYDYGATDSLSIDQISERVSELTGATRDKAEAYVREQLSARAWNRPIFKVFMAQAKENALQAGIAELTDFWLLKPDPTVIQVIFYTVAGDNGDLLQVFTRVIPELRDSSAVPVRAYYADSAEVYQHVDPSWDAPMVEVVRGPARQRVHLASMQTEGELRASLQKLITNAGSAR